MTDSMGLPELPPAFRDLLDWVIPPEHRASVDQSYVQPKWVSFRLNPLRAPIDSTLAELQALPDLCLRPIRGVEGVYRVPPDRRDRLTHHPAASDGRLYIQGLSSMAAVWALGPDPGGEILDLAAAPGGKTSYIAAYLNGTGRLAAVEPVKARFHRLKANLQRLGAAHVHTYLKDGAVVGRLTPQRFDRVLLDAPCSSEAQFTRLDQSSWAHWSPKKVRDSARLQSRLIRSAVEALKPGGVLLYSTCSLSPEENECVVHHLLAEHGNMAVEPLDLPGDLPTRSGLTTWQGQALNPALAAAVRILPSAHTDGFFLCRFRKHPN